MARAGENDPTVVDASSHSSEQPSRVAGLDPRFSNPVEIARGGMGIVYRAYDEKLQRTVAVKTVQVAALSDYARAQREARALARVSSHNNIATIFDVLMEPDAVILVLEWIDGVPFSELIDDGENLSTSLAILEAVAHATEHGHSQGVVHRDLKPSNVLIDRDGEPKLVDFGIARVADGKAKITETGAILGTPAYMAPEQALGELDKVGPATDVYAIGVMLYEVLTGRCPFEGSMQSIIAAHAEREAPMPNSVARNRIPAELEAIALKALAKDPAERYSTALELAEDLCAYREGRAIAARRPGFLRRAHRFVRRHRGVSAALLLGFVGVTSAVLWGLWSIQQAKARADLEKRLERELLEIETSMERAVLQPLHDMSTERDHLRERLRRLAEDRSIDGIAPAEVAFALGSGYLDLQDLQRASDQFSRARELGLRRKQLMEAAAEADTLLYLTKRQQDRAGLGIPETEIEALRSKALASVQRALDRGAWDERYRPILQTLQEDPDVRPELDIPTSGRSAVLALHLAKERLANLSGPALSKGLAEARRLADESLEVRRSDPLLHSLRCGIAVELYAAADRSAAVDFDDVWERRDELSTWCRAAVSAGSDQPEGYIASIAFFTRFADLSMQLGHDTSELVAEGARIAAQGLERWPDDVLLLRLAGQIALSQAAVDRESGEDTSAHFARAAKHAERARQLQPDLPAVYLLSSNVSFNQAMLKMRQGGDYFEEIRAAVDYLDQGLARQNDEDWASDARYRATSVMAMAQLQAGKDPREALAKAIGIGERVLAANPDSFAMLANKTTAHYVRARWAIDHGLSPEDDLAMAAELTARANKIREASTVLSNAVGIAALDAEYRAMRGLPMDDLVARGIQWGERAIEIAPDASAEVYANLARTLLFASTRDPDVISQAMEYAERGLAMIEEHPELRWLRGELLVASGQPKKAKKDLEFAAERGVIEASLGLVAVLASQASSGSDDALQQAQALVVELKKERPDLGAVDFAESKLLEASGAAAETVRAARARAVAKNRWLQIPDEPAVADP